MSKRRRYQLDLFFLLKILVLFSGDCKLPNNFYVCGFRDSSRILGVTPKTMKKIIDMLLKYQLIETINKDDIHRYRTRYWEKIEEYVNRRGKSRAKIYLLTTRGRELLSIVSLICGLKPENFEYCKVFSD